MTSTLNTGEFDPGIASRPWGNTATAFNGQLWVIGAGGGNQIYQTRFTFSGASGEWDIKNSNNWSNTKVAVQGQDYLSSHDKCGSDVLGDGTALYLFWNGGDFIGGARTQGTPATGEPMWESGFVMQDSSGNNFTLASPCDISAVAYGSDSFLVAFPIEQNNAPAIFIGLYNISGQQKSQNPVKTSQGSFVPWPAQAQAIITCDMLNGYPQNGGNNPTIVNVGKSVSITWFASSPASGGDAQVLVMAAFTATLQQPQNNSWPVQLMLPIDPNSGAPLPPGASSPLVMYDDQYPGSPLFTVKDPANRVICYAMGNGMIERWQYSTWSIPTNAPAVANDVSVNHSNDYSPAVVFYIDTANPIQPTPPNTTNLDGSSLAYNVYRFVFYNSGHIYAQASYYGMVEQLPTLILQPDQNADSTLVNCIFDSPFPLPNSNVVGFLFESDNADQGDVTYSVASGTTTGYMQSVNGAVGIHTEYSSAAGIAWNITAQGGGQSTWGTLTTTTVTQVLKQSANVQTAQTSKIGEYVVPEAVFLCSSPRLSMIPYRFADDTVTPTNYIGDPTSTSATDEAPRLSVTGPAQTASFLNSFVPYMVTPGSLASYTPEQINKTMTTLYSNAGWYSPSGPPFTDYFQDVLLANAYKFNGVPYLRYQLTSNASQPPVFNELVQNDKTWGWNTSLSAFVGFGWNVTVPETGTLISQGEIGAQLNFSAQGNWEADSTNNIGISISGLQFPVWDDPSVDGWANAVCNYMFLLLYLPPPSGDDYPPTLWADELRQFATPQIPVTIDKGSEPWRIAFVVIAYQTNQNLGKGWDYYYQGNLPGLQPMSPL